MTFIPGFEASIIVAIIAPLIGIFLVLRRYALIADSLAHVSLAGVALGILLGINPLLTAMGVAVFSSVAIERLRLSKRVSGESALAMFLSGGLALAVVLLSFSNSPDAELEDYLFGSITSVTSLDTILIAALGLLIIVFLMALYKELIYVTFDEEAAKVSGIPVRFVNMVLIFLTALAVSLAIPIVGVLLISALIVIPALAALQLRKSFLKTIMWAEIFSIFSVGAGIAASIWLNIEASGLIVLTAIAIFLVTFLLGSKK
jgi:zinc transport system permease protein